MNFFVKQRPLNSPLLLPEWLDQREHYPKAFWSDRTGEFQVACSGASAVFDSLEACEFIWRNPELGSAPLIGGLRFDPLKPLAPEWSPFGNASFLLPRECVVKKGNSYIEISIESDESYVSPHRSSGSPSDPVYSESYQAWSSYHAKTIKALENPELKKIVIARRVPVEFTQADLKESLNNSRDNRYTFYYAPTPATYFASWSPERLVAFENGRFSCDCIGGTLWQAELGSSNAAVRNEHKIIVEDIMDQLQGVSMDRPEETSNHLLNLGELSHIKSEINGTLSNDKNPLEMIRLLHPTAAVGGFPRENAATFIRENEGFDRGWYAGAVGCIFENKFEFAVGIRSLLSINEKTTAYVGCGVVPESKADREWEETLRKLKSFGF